MLSPALYESANIEIEGKKKYGYKSKDSTRATLQEQDGKTKVRNLLVNLTYQITVSYTPRVFSRIIVALGAID